MLLSSVLQQTKCLIRPLFADDVDVCAFEPSFIRDVVTTLLVSFAEEGEEDQRCHVTLARRYYWKGTNRGDGQTDDKSGLIQLDMYSHVTLKENLHVDTYIKI